MSMKIVVLISGHGSTLQALIDACHHPERAPYLQGQICAVFSDQPQVYGLQRAQQANIPAYTLLPTDYADRATYDLALATEIERHRPDLIVLAGYMRILSPVFVHRFSGRLLNIHPSLLPKYPGLHSHQRAIANGDAEHGATVHFVTDQLDAGPAILQAKVPIFPQDTLEQVVSRVKTQEQQIYPLVVSWFTSRRLEMRDNAAWLDGQRLPAQGYAAD